MEKNKVESVMAAPDKKDHKESSNKTQKIQMLLKRSAPRISYSSDVYV